VQAIQALCRRADDDSINVQVIEPAARPYYLHFDGSTPFRFLTVAR
jgi:hypothetical protein